MQVMRDGRPVTVVVSADGEGLVSHAGSALLARVADRVGLTDGLSRELGSIKERRRGHDPGRVVRDLAVTLADGGDCLADLGALRDQRPLFGEVASNATAYRVIARIAAEPKLLSGLRSARATARERVWGLGLAPERVTLDLDATLVAAHSEKDDAARNYRGGFGFSPLLAYLDETGEALAGILRPGNRAPQNAADQVACAEQALEQIPEAALAGLEVLVRADSAGAALKLTGWCRERKYQFSVGHEITENVRQAILAVKEHEWVAALDQDGSERENGQVVELTSRFDLSRWPEGTRLICRRERPHPGAQLSFTDHDGHRFTAFITDQDDPDIAVLERRQRGRARCEDHIRHDKDTGLRNLPFKDFKQNQVWLELVLIAHDLITWTQALLLDGELAKAEPKRLRYRLLHTAARLAFHGRKARLRLQARWPWAPQLAAAFARLQALPEPAG